MTRRPTCTVPGCVAPVDGRLCGSHLAELTRALRAVAWLDVELELTATRQVRSSGGGDPSGEAPRGLPMAWTASDLRWSLAFTLRAWVVDVAEQRLDPRIAGVHSAPALAAFLLASRDQLRAHPRAEHAHDEITWCVRRVKTAVFGPGPLTSLGPCDQCRHALRVAEGQAAVTCPRCEAEYDVQTRRRALLHRARGTLLTAAELSRVMPELLGAQLHELKVDRIYQWARRGRLTPRPGRRYLVGDVLTLLDVDLDVG